MKTIDKIIESKEAPKDKNVLWVNGDKLLAMVKGKWTPVGGGNSASTKNQDKSVDITENGVTEVTADSGYTGLGKVTINANVQGGGAGGGEDTMEYLDISGLADVKKKVLFLFSHTMRADIGGAYPYMIPSVGFLAEGGISSASMVSKISIDFSQKISDSLSVKTVLDRFLEQGITKNELDAIPRITKEDFYNLTPDVIHFTIEGIDEQIAAAKNKGIYEWCNSSFNIYGYEYKETGNTAAPECISRDGGVTCLYHDGSIVDSYYIIQDNDHFTEKEFSA